MTHTTAHEGSKPACLREDALAVLMRLREAGHVAYFAGGCVRDELLGLVPKDYDIATDAPPDRVRELFRNTQAVGAAFGVILVRHRRSVIEPPDPPIFPSPPSPPSTWMRSFSRLSVATGLVPKN